MEPAGQADASTLVRRLYFDLIGMPPTPDQIDEFLQSESEDEWSRLIDRLLSDSLYGEHWARYWLDIVRYAESDGWNQDAYRSNIWRYRDYVVRSFNKDLPYPRFVREQLAGDEIPGDDPDALVATGYLRLGIYEYNQRDARSHWDDIMNEMTDTSADVFLGLGVACARCHDHKFDPIPQVDYFKLRAFFEPIVWRDDGSAATSANRIVHRKQMEVWQEATKDVRARIDALIKPYHDRKWQTTVDKFPLNIQACFRKPVAERTSWEHQMAYLVERQFLEEGGGPLAKLKKEDKEPYAAMIKELSTFDTLKPDSLPPLMTAHDFEGPISPTLIPGGNKGKSVTPGFPTVLTDPSHSNDTVIAQLPGAPSSSGRRTALAQWIGSADNPLTPRVIVNRIWQHHFGRGIVRTPNDFGLMGKAPTHPELLDWLTLRFIDSGWSFKWLHKQILMSATWRQSTQHSRMNEYQKMDPEEKLLWRFQVRRLSAEQIRDAMLSISGELRRSLGGAGGDSDSPRRSIYVKSFRNTPDKFLHAFDVANGLKSVAERNKTTTPTQSLLLFNGDYALHQAGEMAARLLHMGFSTHRGLLNRAFLLAWGRQPSEIEEAQSLQFLGTTDHEDTLMVEKDKLADLCHVLFNSNEFIYVD